MKEVKQVFKNIFLLIKKLINKDKKHKIIIYQEVNIIEIILIKKHNHLKYKLFLHNNKV